MQTQHRSIVSRYQDRLLKMPAPGHGRHPALLAIANLGIMAGVAPEQIHADIRNAVNGTMPDSEIHDTILTAISDHTPGGSYRPPPRPAPLIKDGTAARRRIIDQSPISDEADLWELSPVRLMEPVEHDTVLLLNTRFRPDDFVFIGDRLEAGVVGQNIRTVAAWVVHFATGGTAGPYIIINPLTGMPAPKKSGDGDSLRGDANVKTFRHCLVEFDTLTREDQLRFWSAAKLPILALIDSGGKSIHAWLDVQKLSTVTTCAQWDQHIKIELYDRVLRPMGVDSACSNPSRLSRLPGHFRSEKEKFQRLLWLSPTGREVRP